MSDRPNTKFMYSIRLSSRRYGVLTVRDSVCSSFTFSVALHILTFFFFFFWNLLTAIAIRNTRCPCPGAPFIFHRIVGYFFELCISMRINFDWFSFRWRVRRAFLRIFAVQSIWSTIETEFRGCGLGIFNCILSFRHCHKWQTSVLII